MKINEWVGEYQLVYSRNDPMEGLVRIFQDLEGKCYEWKAARDPVVEELNLIAGKEKAP